VNTCNLLKKESLSTHGSGGTVRQGSYHFIHSLQVVDFEAVAFATKLNANLVDEHDG
jgi:hypothetical protein